MRTEQCEVAFNPVVGGFLGVFGSLFSSYSGEWQVLATGPLGNYTAIKSDIFRYSGSTRTYGPHTADASEALNAIASTMSDCGWSPVPKGPLWYNLRFTRQVNDLPRSGPLSGSPFTQIHISPESERQRLWATYQVYKGFLDAEIRVGQVLSHSQFSWSQVDRLPQMTTWRQNCRRNGYEYEWMYADLLDKAHQVFEVEGHDWWDEFVEFASTSGVYA